MKKEDVLDVVKLCMRPPEEKEVIVDAEVGLGFIHSLFTHQFVEEAFALGVHLMKSCLLWDRYTRSVSRTAVYHALAKRLVDMAVAVGDTPCEAEVNAWLKKHNTGDKKAAVSRGRGRGKEKDKGKDKEKASPKTPKVRGKAWRVRKVVNAYIRSSRPEKKVADYVALAKHIAETAGCKAEAFILAEQAVADAIEKASTPAGYNPYSTTPSSNDNTDPEAAIEWGIELACDAEIDRKDKAREWSIHLLKVSFFLVVMLFVHLCVI
jgi:hypothetical protein